MTQTVTLATVREAFVAWLRQKISRTPAAPPLTPLGPSTPERESRFKRLEEEAIHMATQASTLAENAVSAVVHPSETTLQKFKSILSHMLDFTEVALADIIQYTPDAVAMSSVLFPEFKLLSPLASVSVVAVTKSVLATVLAIQQKYSKATPSPETNAAKLADALVLVQGSVQALNAVGVKTDDARMTQVINTAVAVLKNVPAPVPPAATTDATTGEVEVPAEPATPAAA
jgi:hypothetical protein